MINIIADSLTGAQYQILAEMIDRVGGIVDLSKCPDWQQTLGWHSQLSHKTGLLITLGTKAAAEATKLSAKHIKGMEIITIRTPVSKFIGCTYSVDTGKQLHLTPERQQLSNVIAAYQQQTEQAETVTVQLSQEDLPEELLSAMDPEESLLDLCNQQSPLLITLRSGHQLAVYPDRLPRKYEIELTIHEFVLLVTALKVMNGTIVAFKNRHGAAFSV